MGRRRQRWGRLMLALSALLLLVIGWLARDRGDLRGQGGQRPPTPLPPARLVSTGADTLLIFETHFTRCGRRLARAEAAGAGRAGLSRDELARRFPDWEISSFTPGRVVLRREEDGPCPPDLGYRTIALRGGRVVILAGRPEAPGEVLTVTDITVDHLLPADREKLERGVVVASEEEAWRFLEGLEE